MKNRLHTRSIRLTFSYKGDEIRLVERRVVATLAPPSDSLSVGKGETGFWYEIRDARDVVQYRRIIQNPIESAVEIRSDVPQRPLSWLKVDEPRGDFDLLIPDLEEARFLALFGASEERGLPVGPSREIARFDLAQGGEGKGAL